MIVLDASAAVSALLHDDAARRAVRSEQLHAPHLVDSEVAHVLRRLVATKALPAARGRSLLTTWGRLAVTRYGTQPLLDRVWQLRANLSAYAAGYVALAEALGTTLLTADARIARAPGIRCPVTVVPR